MKLANENLNTQTIESTTQTGSMGLAENSESFIFEMFTKKIYSDPIGSIVREITSNCFDSHIEAGVTDPVVIKYSYDGVTETHYLSFIDFGVGISPERFENIYSVYFNSSKRETNDQHGAFGLGAKTPLAYRRQIGLSEEDFDNSFSLITKYNGTEYTYLIYSGKKRPEYSIVNTKSTTDHNGSEVKIPILERDMSSFLKAIKNQLFYFENIVFMGFDDYEEGLTDKLNNYKIIKGNTFLFRENCPYETIHVSLGRVMYKINYNLLDLHEYDYTLPVAIQIPIGDIGVTPSREAIDYSSKTIAYLKEKIGKVMEELEGLYHKQFENIYTLEDFIKISDKKNLYFGNNKDFVIENVPFKLKMEDVLINFKYKDIASILSRGNQNYLSSLFIMKRYGKPEPKGYYSRHNDPTILNWVDILYNKIDTKEFVFFSEQDYYDEFKAKRIKNSYIKESLGIERFYILFKRKLDVNNSDDLFADFSSLTKQANDLQNDIWNVIKSKYRDYDTYNVPEDYKTTIQNRKKKIDWGTKAINMYGYNDRRFELPLNVLKNINKIYYTPLDNYNEHNTVLSIYNNLFNNDYILKSYSYDTYRKRFKENISIAIIRVSKTNIKYLEAMPNAKPLDSIYIDLFFRKRDMFDKYFVYDKLIDKYLEIENEIHRIVGSSNITDWFIENYIPEYNNIRTELKEMRNNSFYYVGSNNYYINLFYEKTKLPVPEDNVRVKKIEKLFSKTVKYFEKHKTVFSVIDFPYLVNDDTKEKIEIIKTILKKMKVI